MLLTLIRQAPDYDTGAVMGKLIEKDPIKGDKTWCDTLENIHFLIPELIYPVTVTTSPKFKRLLPLINHVPSNKGSERTGIRIHVGTRPAHSTGCVLVPNRQVERRLTEYLLQIQKSHEEIRIEIKHFEPDFSAYPRSNDELRGPTANDIRAINHSLRLG